MHRIMGNSINKKLKIYHKNICIDHENMINYMILIFTIDEKIVYTCSVPYPEFYKFYDENYLHYNFCHN